MCSQIYGHLWNHAQDAHTTQVRPALSGAAAFGTQQQARPGRQHAAPQPAVQSVPQPRRQLQSEALERFQKGDHMFLQRIDPVSVADIAAIRVEVNGNETEQELQRARMMEQLKRSCVEAEVRVQMTSEAIAAIAAAGPQEVAAPEELLRGRELHPWLVHLHGPDAAAAAAHRSAPRCRPPSHT